MQELTHEQAQSVSGGFWPIVVRLVLPTVINLLWYAVSKKNNNQEMTGQGLAIAAGAGMLSGGVAVGAGAAAGGGFVGNAVWAPTAMTINATGNQIAQGK